MIHKPTDWLVIEEILFYKPNQYPIAHVIQNRLDLHKKCKPRVLYLAKILGGGKN